MNRIDIPLHDLLTPSIDIWEEGWMLLTSGNWKSREYNAMTVSWGSLGVLWHKPFAHVVVRPTRHTFKFMERFPTFTLCAFDDRQRPALSLLGSRSGRDGDKIAASGLTPGPSTIVEAPCFDEATLVFECRTLYWQDIAPEHFLDPMLDRNYPSKDYHRSYFGEIVAIQGVERFKRNA